MFPEARKWIQSPDFWTGCNYEAEKFRNERVRSFGNLGFNHWEAGILTLKSSRVLKGYGKEIMNIMYSRMAPVISSGLSLLFEMT